MTKFSPPIDTFFFNVKNYDKLSSKRTVKEILKMNKTYLTTGEFAKICNINKKTLFFYAEQGIFKPNIIGDNGYHYYSYDQLYIFYIIRALKDIGLSIKEIKNYIDNRSPEALIDFLSEHQKSLKEEIRHKQRLSLLIKNKIQLINRASAITLDEIRLERLPASKLLLSESIHNIQDETEQHHIIQRHINYCLQNDLNVGFQVGGMVSKDDILSLSTDNYSYCFTKTPLSVSKIAPEYARPYIQPAGLYAIGHFRGNYSYYHSAYEKLKEFLDKNNCTIADYSYEEPLIDEISTSDEENHITRIAIKVTES